jgi:hypothetical protein
MQPASAKDLRTTFNDADYWKKVQAGELRAVYQDGNPAPPAANQPPGTMSEMYAYYTLDAKGRLQDKVALVHQYTLPNGQIGGRGRPDPKMVVYQGVAYKYDPKA